MWFLIEAEGMFDVGKNEMQRYLIKEDTIEFKRNLGYLDAMNITALGTEVHPATYNIEGDQK